MIHYLPWRDKAEITMLTVRSPSSPRLSLGSVASILWSCNTSLVSIGNRYPLSPYLETPELLVRLFVFVMGFTPKIGYAFLRKLFICLQDECTRVVPWVGSRHC
jgi:hypothetical protein